MDEQWDLVISSLQDIYNANAVMAYDDDVQLKEIELNTLSDEKLREHLDHYSSHLHNIRRAQRLIDSVGENVKLVLEHAQERERMASKVPPPASPSAAKIESNTGEDTTNATVTENEPPKAPAEATAEAPAEAPIEAPTEAPSETSVEAPTEAPTREALDTQAHPQPQFQQTARPLGRSGWISQYNPNGPISIGSEVAFKPKKGGEGEWFQCVVVKVSADGLRFEVRDPEPDELGNPGKTFKCNWRDIIFIPPEGTDPKSQTPNYPPGTKVLARYPETTTFYPAVVIGSKRDGTCRLRFDGEEEVDKETEVLRRLVLPCPTISSIMAKK
ncbi:hypothetical protein ZYGR_0P01950 [Zygosaccharomyces rouxii]|uniref:ZYRO0E04950p n=2 Tax=Zygosaccharomyces rouxii TaxID=4956 RepID=C5E4D1_ZYGRC|nr:uncharacterized protein ZYRO0E04950g [Zygosaccharomyces rouxii]KAH9198250.1 SAGA-associated factor 29 [Zygosaccharomyces rouxii]GAV49551.1 hypothetical protein ZYGR_0P01950 [Zygosaccharomyces rouxii]CAQ43427.1 SAGA-associated factor 29 [Zygosaccharomyces rouxii]CAR30892.1 ZYRO0E04950p [Zygosaccharomyces rouxii]